MQPDTQCDAGLDAVVTPPGPPSSNAPQGTLGMTREIAARAVQLGRNALPGPVTTVARQCVIDWFAVTLAGLDEPLAGILRDLHSDPVRGGATVVGTRRRTSVAAAALVNGATSHALDYDDVQPLVGHCTTAVFPAALAVAESVGASGEDLLRAFVAGYETATSIGAVAMPGHYARGFHSTGTLGTFGAAAAAGVLLRLDEDQMSIALGLAGAQAAGLKCMFGSMAKPLHAGKAAANGVLAAELARRGYTAHPAVLETPQGFLATQADPDPSRSRRAPAGGFAILGNLFKHHAACYLTHSTIEAMVALVGRHDLTPQDIAVVEVRVPAGHLDVCNIASPSTGLGAKFSLRHAVALAAFRRDTSEVATFSTELALDPQLAAFRERVTVLGDHPHGMGAEVQVTARSGRLFRQECDVGIPQTDLARQGGRLAAKFTSLTEPVLGVPAARSLLARLDGLETAPSVSAILKASAR